MSNANDWLAAWPQAYRNLVQQVCQSCGYTAIDNKKDLSGRGGRTFLAAPLGLVGVPRQLILKFVAADQLSAEVEKAKEATSYFANCNYVRNTFQDGIVACMVLELASIDTPQTFADFFAGSRDSGTVNRVLETLFKSILRTDDLNIRGTPRNAFATHNLDDPEQLRKDLLALRPRAALLLDWWLGIARIDLSTSSERFCHGDLHGKNIIVVGAPTAPEPRIIDFGRTEFRHVFYDHARLERDVALRMFASSSRDIAAELMRLYPTVPKLEDIPATDALLYKAVAAITKIRDLAKELPLPGRADWQKEYFTAVFAQFLFAAANPQADFGQDDGESKGLRRAAVQVCEVLRPLIEKSMALPPPNILDPSKLIREQVLWRLAYAFFRLDQLPSGGWSKTLPAWMEAIWEGDREPIGRNPRMRTVGGADLTGVALYRFVQRVEALVPPEARFGFVDDNQVVYRAVRVMRRSMTRLGIFGGVAVGAAPQLQLRHTAVATVALLKARKVLPQNFTDDDLIRQCLSYLTENLARWRDDQTNYFGLWTALLKMEELLKETTVQQDFDQTAVKVLDAIQNVRSEIRNQLLILHDSWPQQRPAGTLRTLAESCFPRPYYDFWRMQRSGFLLYLPFLVTEDEQLNPALQASLRRRYARALGQLLASVVPQAEPVESLVPYHQDPDGGPRAPGYCADWGLSASLAAALRFPCIRNWLGNEAVSTGQAVDTGRTVLSAALLATFDQYARKPNAFRFTTGPSFADYLDVAAGVNPESLRKLDLKLTEKLRRGVTEKDLDELVDWICQDAGAVDEVDSNSIREMLLAKLESGEYTPDRLPDDGSNLYQPICSRDTWERRVMSVVGTTTITAYNGLAGQLYSAAYGRTPVMKLIADLSDPKLLGDRERNGLKALDVGCGPGQYAELLASQGFEVDLLDASTVMLAQAAARLNMTSVPAPWNIYALLSLPLIENSYDLIFACAMMVHVPRDKAPPLYERFFEMLKPGGVLFVNFKIQDHTLISVDDRFYEYYADIATPERELKAARFQVEVVNNVPNRTDLRGRNRLIKWANFYCKKPEREAAAP